MDIDDKELFSSAMADAEIPEVSEQPAEAPAQETTQQDDRPRDEHGRFAPKQPAEPDPEPPAPPQAVQAATDEAQIPPWRLREMREERDAANQRYQETQRQLEMLQRQMPKPEPKPAPDLFENPTGAIEYGVQQGLTPYEQRLQAMEAREQARLEYYSRREAFREHGEPTVRTAYDWLADGVSKRDPDVMHVYNRAMQSEHPYDAVVQAYKRVSVMQQIEAAGGVDKWREQQLAAGQPQQQQNRQTSNQPQGSITKLPPSLRNTPSARGNGADDEPSDMSDAALFRHAMR
jgi:hypothetical protein